MKCLIFLCALTLTSAQWHTCDTREFCARLRNQQYGESPYELILDGEPVFGATFNANLRNKLTGKLLNFTLTTLVDSTFRVLIDDPENVRHSAAEALDGEPTTQDLTSLTYIPGSLVGLGVGSSEALIHLNPFRVEFFRDNEIVVILNGDGRFTFSSEIDEAIALDISFPQAQRAYGIPMHAERLSLRTTGPGGLNPYRLFNVDHYGYAIGTQDSLYGAIPVLYGHGTTRTAGIFWLNSAQTFIDINNGVGPIDSFFISETGVLDLFVFTGPTLADSVAQYTRLTGRTPLPQYFTLGYHQSRYSYMTQEDVETVIAEFDNHDFPMDVIWLDIDYTYGYRYFTWNITSFPEPVQMQQNIVATGRKLVAIIDPHYKVDPEYHVYIQAMENGFYVRNPDGSAFQGICWPGLSIYIDFFYPAALDWFSNLYLLENFPNSTLDMYIWNDMNEPSVFEVEENSMDPDVLHYGGWTHRDLHNMYGYKMTQGTRQGLLRRNSETRPFLLTRSHFAGSQRFAAMWTGDNVASWEHLRISIPMLLTQSLAGMSFCGADIGGFVDNPSEELLQRWYQAGAWYPFYRGHSAIDTDRREPYLFPEDVQHRIRTALRQRYAHLPVWYTLWFEHERYGQPIIRPLSYHYPEDPGTLDIDTQWLVGANILVSPVLEENAANIVSYIPGGFGEFWFDIDNNLLYPGAGNFLINVNMDSAPVFYRAGSILFRRNTPRPSSSQTLTDDMTIYIFEGIDGHATGNLYFDDHTSFNYRNLQYLYLRYEFYDDGLTITQIDDNAFYDPPSFVFIIFLYRIPTELKQNRNHDAKVYEIQPEIINGTFDLRTKFFKFV